MPITKRIISKGLLILICLASLLALFSSSRQEGAIMDELAHIPAGYGYIDALDARLNPEHPPLLKVLAALPLLFLKLQFPYDKSSWASDVNGQWAAGTQFLYEMGNPADTIIQYARFAPIVLTILLSLFIWHWARKRMGKIWAAVPTALFALSPTVLAHGHYVTTDIAAAFGVVVATHYFLDFLFTSTNRNLWKAGLAFGLAQTLKFSIFLLIPFFLAAGGAYLILRTLSEKYQQNTFSWNVFWRQAGSLAASLIGIFAIGYALVVYPLYTVITWNYPAAKQISDTKEILASYAGGPTPNGSSCALLRCPADITIRMAGNPVTRPLAQYLLGLLMVFQRASGGNTGYFMGSVSSGGSHWYFPALFMFKETLPSIIIVAVAIFYALLCFYRWAKKNNRMAHAVSFLTDNFTEAAMAFFVAMYWGSSIISPLNIGIRHLMPTFPFIYLLASRAWKGWVHRADIASDTDYPHALIKWVRKVFAKSLKLAALVSLLLWFAGEVAVASPYYISYYNELAGGTGNGYRIATDSNYDWGQDILRLKEWMDKNPQVDRIALEYFGGAKPAYYLGDKAVDWNSRKGSPLGEGISYFAISVGNLQNSVQPTKDGFFRDSADSYSWLLESHPKATGRGNLPDPDYKIGTSIFVYKLR